MKNHNQQRNRITLRRIYIDTLMISLLTFSAGVIVGYVLAKFGG